MTLIAPEHLRGKMTRAPAALRQERDEWIREAHRQGHTAVSIADALGLNHVATCRHMRSIGCGRVVKHSTGNLALNGILCGNVQTAIRGLPPDARGCLADQAARAGATMAAVLADFWSQHHGAQE